MAHHTRIDEWGDSQIVTEKVPVSGGFKGLTGGWKINNLWINGFKVIHEGMRLPEHKAIVTGEDGKVFLHYTFCCNAEHRDTVTGWHEYAEALCRGKVIPHP
jgi:hypothetical protein